MQGAARLHAADLQQRGVRLAADGERQVGLRARVRPGPHVHHQAVVCEGLGGGVQAQDCDRHTLLDRGPPQRALAVARQGSNANGVTHTEMWIQQLT